MKIIFDFEGRDEDCAFFVLYAGLRMYYDLKRKQPTKEGQMSIAAAEAHCMLQDLKKQDETAYYEAYAEYEHIYG